ncbi:MAG TPA: hypothetical protein VK824_10620 [Planctomycetota bacterium]|nr:hypothetical protein [Planctomycetota bacterium]
MNDPAAPELFAAVESLKATADCPDSLGDPNWHYRWEGAVQLVGLDARSRSVTDVRQRLLRLVHECDLRHMPRSRRRVLAVVLCEPQADEGLRGWQLRLDADEGEVGASDWRAARRRVAVLALDGSGGHLLSGGDRAVRQAVEAWSGARVPAG